MTEPVGSAVAEASPGELEGLSEEMGEDESEVVGREVEEGDSLERVESVGEEEGERVER